MKPEYSLKPRIGVSACIVGHAVRYSGDASSHPWVYEHLAAHADMIPFCPESSMGLGVPREPIRLVRPNDGAIQVKTSRSGRDLTESAHHTTAAVLDSLGDLDGIVLKKGSPACGLARVKVYRGDEGGAAADGIGFFAAAIQTRFSTVPIIEDGRLYDAVQREHFMTRVYARARFRQLPQRMRDIQLFHAAHKYLLMSHAPESSRRLGRIVANHGQVGIAEVFRAYEREMHEALRLPSQPSRMVNALMHLVGYFKKMLAPLEKKQILSVIEDYRQGLVPLLVPIQILSHWAEKFDIPYVRQQLLLAPHPKELALRSRL